MALLGVDGVARVRDGHVLEDPDFARVPVHADLGGAPSHFPERRPRPEGGLGVLRAFLPAFSHDGAPGALQPLHQRRERKGDLPHARRAAPEDHGRGRVPGQ